MAADRVLRLPRAVPARSLLRFSPISGIGLLRLAVLGGFLLLWELLYRNGTIDAFFFSSPSLIWHVLYRLFESGRIWPHLQATAQEALEGLALGLIAGAVVAWLAYQTRLLGQLIEPFMLLMNSVPRIVLAPIFIMWFGIGTNSKVASAFFLVFVVIFFAVYTGLQEVPQALVNRVRMLGGGRKDVLTQVYVPSVLTWVFSSMRVTVGFAFTGAVVGEFIGSTKGLGYLLNFAQGSFNSSLMMATVVLIMAMIMALFVVIQRIEDHLMRWKQAR